MFDKSAEVWRNRLPGGLDPRAQALNDSLPIDRRLWPEELALTRAYAASLVESAILTEDDAAALMTAADDIEQGIEAGAVTLAGEDIHSAIEAELLKRAPAAARRLHTGRSRNDQVATLFRLHVMRLCDETVALLQDLERSLVHQAELAGTLVAPGMTHLQPAQPVLLAHVWLAHVAAFERDEARFLSARESADLLPLGSGALAGTPLRYDRAALARRLGFTRVCANSLDAVGDRDFALEYLGAAGTLGIHLSRLAEDLVLWCSPGFGWFRPPDGWSTGSSLLPQKRNPDIFELTRGKAARLVANGTRLQLLLKGLPSSYQKDLQEDKEPVFDTADTISTLLEALSPAIRALQPIPEKLESCLSADLLAVELADQLVDMGVPFKEAHAAVGRLWSLAEECQVGVADLDEARALAISPEFTRERLRSLSIDSALARRNHSPGTGPEQVRRQLEAAEARLGLSVLEEPCDVTNGNGHTGEPSLRPARPGDVPRIAALMASFVAEGTLLPRPLSELYQCYREFHVAVENGEIVACAALRILWQDLGEVRSLVVAPGHQGKGLGLALVDQMVRNAREIGLPRVIALTRTPSFFEKAGFTIIERESLPRKIWTDCIHCPRRHACDEIAVVIDLVPGATKKADAETLDMELPIPPPLVR